jgi:hypothetical protein
MYIYTHTHKNTYTYRVIHKSLRDFRPLWYSSRDGHTKGEHVNRVRDTPSFWLTLQVLDMSTLGDVADVNSVIKFLPRDLPQLRRRIVEAVAAIDSPDVATCVAGTLLQD